MNRRSVHTNKLTMPSASCTSLYSLGCLACFDGAVLVRRACCACYIHCLLPLQWQPAKLLAPCAGHLQQVEPVHTALPGMQQTLAAPMTGQMPEQSSPLRRSASLDYPLPLHLPDSSMTCQTPVQQQRHLTGSLSGLQSPSLHQQASCT